jgi:hypothetical protein
MAEDALDPGENGDFPFWPRRRRQDGEVEPDPERMPTGVRRNRSPDGTVRLVDLTARDNQTGEPIGPPAPPPE